MPTAADSVHAPATPDWSAVADEITCPLCEYNLRGLAEPRCPECGYQFQWRELLDVNRRAHPYLFEHHPERNIWSLCRTMIGGLRPSVFWRSLHPAQRSRPRRLALYALLCLLPVLIGYGVTLGAIFSDGAATLYHRILANGHVLAHVWWFIGYVMRHSFRHGNLLIFMCGTVLWPWLTYLGLLIFAWSMRRARVRRIHVIRCIVYSSDLLVLLLAPACAVALVFQPINAPFPPNFVFERIWLPVAFLLWIVFVHRLIQAYRHYLRFDHVVATVLASQVMAGLVLWKLWLTMEGF
jgi:hypothetical protein